MAFECNSLLPHKIQIGAHELRVIEIKFATENAFNGDRFGFRGKGLQRYTFFG